MRFDGPPGSSCIISFLARSEMLRERLQACLPTGVTLRFSSKFHWSDPKIGYLYGTDDGALLDDARQASNAFLLDVLSRVSSLSFIIPRFQYPVFVSCFKSEGKELISKKGRAILQELQEHGVVEWTPPPKRINISAEQPEPRELEVEIVLKHFRSRISPFCPPAESEEDEDGDEYLQDLKARAQSFFAGRPRFLRQPSRLQQ